MALTSEDIIISQASGWMALVVTNTVLHITDIRNNKIFCRFDIASTSKGFVLNTGDTLATNETIYVKSFDKFLKDAALVVVKD